MSFEGIEKKFELLVAPDHPSLRALGGDFWSQVVERARAAVLSRISNGICDAYLLSESSLFVYDERAIMITCGKTNLVAAIEDLMTRIPLLRIQSFIYERKNENFPQLQNSGFADDVRTLKGILPGTARCFGDPKGHHLSLYHLDRGFQPDDQDMTLEILMYDLDPQVRNIFTSPKDSDPLRVAQSRVRNLLPGFLTEDYCFHPAGYSLNGLKDRGYFTVHITPEAPGSYASLETNAVLPGSGIQDLISRTVGFFRPARFDVVLFQGKVQLSGTSDYRLGKEESATLGCGYDLRFSHFTLNPATAALHRAGAAPGADHPPA